MMGSLGVAGALAAGLRPDQVAISNRVGGKDREALERIYREMLAGGDGIDAAGAAPAEKPAAEPAGKITTPSMKFPDTEGFVRSDANKSREADSAMAFLGEEKAKASGGDEELSSILEKVRSGRGILTDRDRAILAATLGPQGAAVVQNSVRTQRRETEKKPRAIALNKERLARQRMRRAEERDDLSEQERERLKTSAKKLLEEAGETRERNNLLH